MGANRAPLVKLEVNPPMSLSLSIVIPTLNEAGQIDGLLRSLQSLQEAGAEIVVSDGGSTDDTIAKVAAKATVVSAAKGRARQMNAGAAQASGEWLLFLHADTRLPPDAVAILACVSRCREVCWGFFPVKLSGGQIGLRIVERMMNWRSRFTCVATGDQALFVRRSLFNHLGGFSDIPLMEDVDLSRQLKRCSRPVIPNRKVVTSSRRWEEKGLVKTVLTMWYLRAAYACGASPAWLAKLYYKAD